MSNQILELRAEYLEIQDKIEQGQQWLKEQQEKQQKVVDKLAEFVNNNKLDGDVTKDLGSGVKVKSSITLKPIFDKKKVEENKDKLPKGLLQIKEEVNKSQFKKLLEDSSHEAQMIKDAIGASYEQKEKFTVYIDREAVL